MTKKRCELCGEPSADEGDPLVCIEEPDDDPTPAHVLCWLWFAHYAVAKMGGEA